MHSTQTDLLKNQEFKGSNPPWCQFHQHFMSSFCAKIFLPKITNPNVCTKKLRKKLLYKKAARKILVKLTPGGAKK
jgi:hypothetical protein